jgi:AcrR family transcriptional regulator
MDLKMVSAQSVKPRKTEDRLDSGAWIDAALDELALHGIDGVRIEVIAKRLSVTKGSFYWHFKDRETLLGMMLDRWRKRATLALIEKLDRAGETPEDRLRRLLRLPITGQRSALAADLELSVRLWGRRDGRAKLALQEVDELRLRYIAGLLADMGAAPKDAESRAILAYSYMRVAATLVDPDDADTMKYCEDVLIGVPR